MATLRHITIGPNGMPQDETGYISPSQAAQYAHMFVPDQAQRQAVNQDAYDRGVMTPEIEQILEQYASQHGVSQSNPFGDVPHNTFAHQNNGWNAKTGKYDIGMNMGGLGGAILGGAAVAGPALIGPALAGMGGTAVVPSLGEAAVNSTGTVAPGVVNLGGGAATAGGAAGAGAKSVGGFGKLFSKGIDPTALLLSGLSMFGSDPENFQRKQSFSGTSADPKQAVTDYLNAIKDMTSRLSRRQPTQLNAVELGTPHPVTVPGVPFQIGGGLGTDPALKATLAAGGDATLPDLSVGTSSSGARRRNPNG